jgi:hypothetical protein
MLPANSKNPANFVKVKVNHPLLSVKPKSNYLKDSCWILEPEPIKSVPEITISATRKYIITSIKK